MDLEVSLESRGRNFYSRRRNYMLVSNRKDGLIEWMKEMLIHSFALDAKDSYYGTMEFFEELINEYRSLFTSPDGFSRSRLALLVPTAGPFHTSLPIAKAFEIYDSKYSISKRRHISPTFNEIRHILNLAQVMAIGENLQLMSFDGDQTLYKDGGNFDADNDELALAIIRLLCHNVKVAVITAAGYGLDGSKYEHRLRGLLDRFVEENMTPSQIENFFVFGGECNYLLQCSLQDDSEERGYMRARLVPVLPEVWQAEHIGGPKPQSWPQEQIKELLDIAERTMQNAKDELNLRAKVLRKERAVGIYPGGKEMCKSVPIGHGSNKLKREALDEVVLRVVEELRAQEPPVSLPYCVFNGGMDAWLDVGNKSVAVAALQAFLQLEPANCLHVGDQFTNLGNDIAARKTCPCIWIINPRETGKILQYVLKYKHIRQITSDEGATMSRKIKEGDAAQLNVYTGESC